MTFPPPVEGDRARVGCFYIFCSAVVTMRLVRPYLGKEPRWMAQEHEIQNPYLKGICPTSGQYMPPDEELQSILNGRQVTDKHRMEEARRLERERESRPPEPRATSRSLRQPGRIGREPSSEGEERNHWFPPRPPEEEPHVKPHGVTGQPLGSRGMTTVEDLISQIAEANVKSEEAAGALLQAKEEGEAAMAQLNEAGRNLANAIGAVNSARDLVAMTMEQVGVSATLGEMYALLQGALDEDLLPISPNYRESGNSTAAAIEGGEQGKTKALAAVEKGQQFISNMTA